MLLASAFFTGSDGGGAGNEANTCTLQSAELRCSLCVNNSTTIFMYLTYECILRKRQNSSYHVPLPCPSCLPEAGCKFRVFFRPFSWHLMRR